MLLESITVHKPTPAAASAVYKAYKQVVREREVADDDMLGVEYKVSFLCVLFAI